MATLAGLKKKGWSNYDIARAFQERDHDTSEARVREASTLRKGRRTDTQRKNRAQMERWAKEIDLRKVKHPPSEAIVSAKVISSPVRTRTITSRYGGMVTVQSGRYPHIDRANDQETWPLPRRPLHRESLERLITEAQRQFDGDLVRVVIYGRFMARRGKYRLSARGGDLGWREDRFAINTHAGVLEQLLHEVNRDITREMNRAETARERRWIQDGNPDDDERYPSPSARWATKLTASMEHPTAERWSEVNWVMVQRVLPTIKSQM